jgi:hypothetical protein
MRSGANQSGGAGEGGKHPAEPRRYYGGYTLAECRLNADWLDMQHFFKMADMVRGMANEIECLQAQIATMEAQR